MEGVVLIPIDQLRIPNDDTAIPLLRDETYLVAEYAAAMSVYEGWGEFPPALVDQEYLILGGVTRVRAARKIELTEVPCVIRECETDGERLLAAAADNATNSKRWDSAAITKMALLAERVSVDTDDLAHALRVPVSRVERVPVVAIERIRDTTGERYSERVYAKRAVRGHVGSRVLTEREEAHMRQLTTPNPAHLILRDIIRLDVLNALPPLSQESRKDLEAVQVILEQWLLRDRHLLEGGVVA